MATPKISEALMDIMPSEYHDLVTNSTYGKEDRGWKDIGNKKELIEQHSLCAGCPESMAFRYILASLPNPEDTVMVGSTGCTSLVFPMVAVHNIHSLFGNQNAIASGLKRAFSVRFPHKVKDVGLDRLTFWGATEMHEAKDGENQHNDSTSQRCPHRVHCDLT